MRQRFLDVEHERFRFGEPGRLDHNPLGRDLLDDLVHRRFEFPKQRATNAATAELGDSHVFAFNHFRVDRDFAELIHHDRDFLALRCENMTEQGRLPAAKWTSDYCDWCARIHVTNDEIRRTNTEGNPNDEVRNNSLTLATALSSCFVISSSFVIRASSFTLSFHISNRRESRDRLADPCQLGRCNYFINIFVSATCFLRETCP